MRGKITLALFSTGFVFGSLFANINQNNEESVKAFLNEFTDALNQNKVDDFASYWTEDGELVKPTTGTVIEGNEKIAAELKNTVQALHGNKIKFTIGHIDFPDADSAVVEGLLQIFDKDKLVEQAARKIELVKQNNEWYLALIKEIKIDETPSTSFEHLKDLQWLLGTWKDTDDNVTIEFKTGFDIYKNFINQRFTMQIYGQTVMEGLQIFGWNPIDNKLVSWIFDSDGGYGTGDFEKRDGKWFLKINYTLSDGKKATSTNIYTPINATSYSFSSIDRIVDGNTLPNVEPVTVVKEE